MKWWRKRKERPQDAQPEQEAAAVGKDLFEEIESASVALRLKAAHTTEVLRTMMQLDENELREQLDMDPAAVRIFDAQYREYVTLLPLDVVLWYSKTIRPWLRAMDGERS